jgi:uncharacterized membrane protein
MRLKKEFFCIGMAFLPFVYLWLSWSALPQHIPIHWNTRGEEDVWGSKAQLFIPVFIPVLTYILLLVIPFTATSRKISRMGRKYDGLKDMMVFFMSFLSLYTIYVAKTQVLFNVSLLAALFFIIMGNYLKVLQPNYYIGIRSPWTLKNDTVWKQTHLFSGKIWMAAGIALLLANFFIPENLEGYVLIAVLLLISLVPLCYSYLIYRKLKV